MVDLESGLSSTRDSEAFQKEIDEEKYTPSVESSLHDNKPEAVDTRRSVIVDWDGPNDPEFPQNL